MHLPEDTYQQARRFLEATRVLSNFITENKFTNPVCLQMYVPWVVLAAFTCELYLKCVIYYQTGKRATGHDIGNLFDQLNDGTRKLLKEKLERVEIIVKEDFSAEIEDASKAFSKWRYLYEGAPRGFINSRLLESISVLLNYYIEGEEVEWPLRYVASVKDDCI